MASRSAAAALCSVAALLAVVIGHPVSVSDAFHGYDVRSLETIRREIVASKVERQFVTSTGVWERQTTTSFPLKRLHTISPEPAERKT